MLQKIIDALKIEYKNLGFSEKTFEKLANIINVQIKEETEIDAAVKGADALVKVIQGESDIRVNTHIANAKKGKGAEPEKTEPENKGGEDTTEIGKLMKIVTGLTQTVQSMQKGQITDVRKVELTTKLEGLPPTMQTKILKDFSKMQFESDEDFQTYLGETETEVKEAIQELNNQGFKSAHQPGGSGQKAPTSDGKTESSISATEIQAWAKSKETPTRDKTDQAAV